MSQAWAAVGWKIASLIDAEVSPGGVGWCFVLRAGGQERVVVAQGWARAPWEATQPGVRVTADSRFQLASMSKPVTNLATRALVDDWEAARRYLGGFHVLPNPLPWPPASGPGIPTGLTSNLVARVHSAAFNLTLDHPVLDLIGYRLSQPPGPGVNQITLRNLLYHASGINLDAVTWPDGGDQDTIDLWGDISATFAQGVAPGHTPGDGYPGYNNKHYMILRAIVEDVMGVEYETHCQQRIWHRAGTVAPSCHDDDPAPTLYYARVNPVPGVQPTAAPGPGAFFPDYANRAGAFGWYASMRDYTRLLEAVRAGRVLSTTQTGDFLSSSAAVMTFNAGTSTGIGHNGGWGTDGGSVGSCAATFDNGFAAALVINNDSGVDPTDLFTRIMAGLVPAVDAPVAAYVAPPVSVRNQYGLGDLRATTDGSPVTATSPLVANPVGYAGDQPVTVHAAVYDGTTPVTFAVSQTVSPPATLRPGHAAATSAAGWKWRQVQGTQGQFTRIPTFAGAVPVTNSGTGLTLDDTLGGGTGVYALEFTSWLAVPADGFYTFSLTSDDGSRLWIGDALVCDNDGVHGSQTVDGVIGLGAGAHPCRVEYLQAGGGAALSLNWSGPGFASRPVATSDVNLPDTHQPAAIDANPAGNGIRWQLAPTHAGTVPGPPGELPVVASGIAAGIGLTGVTGTTNYVLWFDGWLNAPATGTFAFSLTSDDGAIMRIGPELVIDNDGMHGPQTATGSIDLAVGRHRVQVGYIQGGGGQTLSVTWSGPRISGNSPLDAFLSILPA